MKTHVTLTIAALTTCLTTAIIGTVGWLHLLLLTISIAHTLKATNPEKTRMVSPAHHRTHRGRHVTHSYQPTQTPTHTF